MSFSPVQITEMLKSYEEDHKTGMDIEDMAQDKLWDGAKSLYEMLELEDELKPFVNDFKLNLFDYHEWKDFSRFKTANRLLFEALSCGSDRKRMKKILRENPGYKALDLESAKAIRGMLGVRK